MIGIITVTFAIPLFANPMNEDPLTVIVTVPLVKLFPYTSVKLNNTVTMLPVCPVVV